MKIETEDIVSVSTYADIKGVAVKTIYNWIDKKMVKIVILDGKIFVDQKISEIWLRADDNYKARLMWCAFYEKMIGIKPAFNKKEGANLKLLMTYLNSISDNKGLEMFEYILLNWDKIDTFVRKAGTISVLNSNINNVIITLKNGKQDKHNDTIDAFNNL